MNRFLIAILLTFLNAQYINQETGWQFHQSSSQSFYIFESIQIDGENPEGDGWAPSLTLESECVDNPNSCDVVGAFLNNICVGWVYADEEGWTTLLALGYSSSDNGDWDYYCSMGDVINIKYYDASEEHTMQMVNSDDGSLFTPDPWSSLGMFMFCEAGAAAGCSGGDCCWIQ